MTESSNSGRRQYMSGRAPVPDLWERLQLLFAKSRNPRIKKVIQLDAELKLDGDRSVRQWYRKDRTNGIPGELLEEFLAVFRLRQDELLLPLEDFEKLWTVRHPTDGRPSVGMARSHGSPRPGSGRRVRAMFASSGPLYG